jgi:hypothetical protein
MRKIAIVGLGVLGCLLALPVHARRIEHEQPLCCQFGTTYGTSGIAPSCKDIPFPHEGPMEASCIKAEGMITVGPCNTDGACGGSPVCCEGFVLDEELDCRVSVCAKATETACDAVSPAGGHTTRSVPFSICVPKSGGFFPHCQGPTP